MKHNIFKTLIVLGMFLFAMGAWADPTVTFIKKLNGETATASSPGEASSNISEGVCTLTVTPGEGNYVTSEFITVSSTVTGNMAHVRPQTPNVDVSTITVTPTNASADPSTTTTYTFTMPSDGSNAEVIIDFQSRKSVTEEMITLSSTSFTYNGSEQSPTVTVTDGTTTLTANTHYTVSIEIEEDPTTPINADTYDVVVTGIGTYTSSATKTFTITAKSITEDMVTLSASTFVYNGDIQYPTITLKDGSDLTEGEDFDYAYEQDGEGVDGPGEVGSYDLIISGTGNYGGQVTKTVTITAREVTPTVTLATTSYTYDGTAKEPDISKVTVPDIQNQEESIELEEGDYEVAYTDNTNAGENTAKATVTLKGNYSGSGYATFTIEQADLSNYVITGLAESTAYTGSAITPTFSVKATAAAETSLTANTDYSVKYQKAGADVEEMKDAGDYTIHITGEGNYKGSLDAGFTIARAQLELTINLEDWTYGDAPNEPSLDGNLGEDNITWEYKAAGAEAYSAWSTLTATTDAGTYMVRATVAETDNYEGGSAEVEFVIDQYDLANATVTLDYDELVYNGQEQTVNVTKVMAGDIEVPVDCYEVSGNTGKEAKTYTLTVTAKTKDSSGNDIKNNFKGSVNKDWKIAHHQATLEELGFADGQTYATYYTEAGAFTLPDNVVAYVITGVSGNSVTTQRISYIPMGVAVLLMEGTSTEETSDDLTTNLLQGTATAKDVNTITGGTVYVLHNGEFVKTTTGTIPANRCYLVIPGTAGARSFSISHSDGNATGIEKIENGEWRNDNWYDLQGRRIEKPTKDGLYIKNGKKVVINNK